MQMSSQRRQARSRDSRGTYKELRKVLCRRRGRLFYHGGKTYALTNSVGGSKRHLLQKRCDREGGCPEEQASLSHKKIGVAIRSPFPSSRLFALRVLHVQSLVHQPGALLTHSLKQDLGCRHRLLHVPSCIINLPTTPPCSATDEEFGYDY